MVYDSQLLVRPMARMYAGGVLDCRARVGGPGGSRRSVVAMTRPACRVSSRFMEVDEWDGCRV